ncbi:MAG TPA: carbamoyltransferase C-terminal domain-containing protein [Micromonosporaceae bacterium]
MAASPDKHVAVVAVAGDPMRVLGISKGSTLSGKTLRHGSAAAYIDGEICALAEERASGEKYAGGYERSLAALLSYRGVDIDDFDVIGVSTCCEPEQNALLGHELAGEENLVSVNHHLSHASLAFYGSGFESALVVVADGGGNTLVTVSDEWWTQPREQNSYYLATRTGGIKLIARDFDEPYDVGLGELYRAFTYFLGWHSSRHASKTMALAGHGRRAAISAELYAFENGKPRSVVRNNPYRPVDVVLNLGQALGVNLGEPRVPNQAILQIHRDVAAFVQREIEGVLLRRLRDLRAEHGASRLCIGGGVALNVVANGRLLKEFPEGVYIPSAPADDGQALGNVYALLAAHRKQHRASSMLTSSSACLGTSAEIDSATVTHNLHELGLARYVVLETSDYSRLVSEFLASGATVCLFQNRSEYGPRALGCRSILADPRRGTAVSELNSLKGREWFMPFAPAVLRDRMGEWFEPIAKSPFMSFALRALPRALHEIPAVVNADGTARVQTVEAADGTAIHRILTAFEQTTGVPVLLNTSFNLGGKPIVETIQQALTTFSQMPVNVLSIGRFVIVKNLSPDIADLPIKSSLKRLEMDVRNEGSSTAINTAVSLSRMVRQLQKLTGAVVFVRTALPLYDQYLEWMRQGRKVTTIRFRRGAVEIPFNSVLPLFETPDYSAPDDKTTPTEYVRVAAIRYRRFGELTATDATRDGFEDLDHMRRDLTTIYPRLTDDDWVTVYDISLVNGSKRD